MENLTRIPLKGLSNDPVRKVEPEDLERLAPFLGLAPDATPDPTPAS